MVPGTGGYICPLGWSGSFAVNGTVLLAFALSKDDLVAIKIVIKSYGKMLSTDHAAANQRAIEAAKGLGVNPPSGPNAKQKADYEKMSKMSGAAFDKMFATHMVADHQKDITEYMKASEVKDAAGEYASGQIETLRKHLDAAKSLKSGK